MDQVNRLRQVSICLPETRHLADSLVLLAPQDTDVKLAALESRVNEKIELVRREVTGLLEAHRKDTKLHVETKVTNTSFIQDQSA